MIRSRSGPTSSDDLFNKLFDEQFGPLTRAIVLMVDSRQEAEEIVQEAFARLLTSRRKVRKLDDAPAYLRSTAFNLARSQLRKRRTERKNSDFVRQRHVEQAGFQHSPESSTLEAAGSAEMIAALATLPTRQRECLVLRYYVSLAEADIAETLGISKGSVKTHTSRGLQALQAVLGESNE